MAYPEGSLLVCALSFIQIAGLASAWMARLSEGSHRQARYHWLFLAFLALIGSTTMICAAFGSAHWLTSGSTLGAMVLAAIWDFRPHTPAQEHGELATQVHLDLA